MAADTVPTGSLRMIHSGKFMPDDKTLKARALALALALALARYRPSF